VGLKLNADDINLLGDNFSNLKKNTETLIGISEEVGLEVNEEKTKQGPASPGTRVCNALCRQPHG
jgi:hypothetical protein